MAAIEHLTISLPAKMAAKLRERVAAGEFPDIDTAVAEALLGLEVSHSEIDVAAEEEFIRREVLPALARYDADPSRAMSMEQVDEYLARSREQRERARC